MRSFFCCPALGQQGQKGMVCSRKFEAVMLASVLSFALCGAWASEAEPVKENGKDASAAGTFESPDKSEKPLPVATPRDADRADVKEQAAPAEGEAPTNTEAAPAEGGEKPVDVADPKPAEGAAAAEGDKKVSTEFSDKVHRESETEEEMEYLYVNPPSIEGYAGWKHHNRVPKSAIDQDLLPIPDRWRIGMPANTLRVKGDLWNPYRQNMIKGDYPIIGQSIFLSLLAVSDTLVEGRSVPTPSNVSTARGRSQDFFGRPDQFIFNQNFILSVELFKGESDFKPREWEFRLTPVFNFNYVDVEENFVLNIDPRRGNERLDHQIAFQELFGEYHFRDISPSYDFMSSRTGIQFFNEDFRGFLFADNNLGVRVFGNYEANRLQYNFAAFEMLNKDTNSGLNSTFEFKDEHVLLASLVRQDTFFKGYNIIGQLAFSAEESTLEYNQNGVIVRPTPIGDLQPHNVKAGYIGFGGDGHIGRLNLSHQFYQAFGRDDRNPLSGKSEEINARMFALEASVDVDWMRIRTSFFYASGDEDVYDGKAEGWDAIFENPNFAGGQFSYWVRQGFGAGNAPTSLKSRFSLAPNLSSSKDEGQANFVNPGLQLFNIGYDAELTQNLKAVLNFSYLRFDNTDSLEVLLQQNGIDRQLGLDYSLGMIYRPWLSQQVVLTGGIAGFSPLQGFQDIYVSKETLYSGFLGITVRY
jgi:hypothetical protein